jgi:hypothetical protein
MLCLLLRSVTREVPSALNYLIILFEWLINDINEGSISIRSAADEFDQAKIYLKTCLHHFLSLFWDNIIKMAWKAGLRC